MHDYTPAFLIIGAAKAATTMLASMLDQHPQAGIIQGKEPHFFSMDPVYARGWKWYQSGFQRCRGKQVLGDASTSYSRLRYHPATIPRIRHHVPDIKIIYMVRHPIERITSAYVERLASIDARRGYPDINRAVRAEPMMIDSSRYWEVYTQYRAAFGERRVKVIWFEEFTRDPGPVFADTCRFLEIDDTVRPDHDKTVRNSRDDVMRVIKENGTPTARINTDWNNDTLNWAIRQIRDDNRKLLKHFGKSENYWAGI